MLINDCSLEPMDTLTEVCIIVAISIGTVCLLMRCVKSYKHTETVKASNTVPNKNTTDLKLSEVPCVIDKHSRIVKRAIGDKEALQTTSGRQWMVTANTEEFVKNRYQEFMQIGIHTNFIKTMILEYNASNKSAEKGNRRSLRALIIFVDVLSFVYGNMYNCIRLSKVYTDPERDEAFARYTKERRLANKRAMFYLCKIKYGSLTSTQISEIGEGISGILDILDGYVTTCRLLFYQIEKDIENYRYFGLSLYGLTFEKAFATFMETQKTGHLIAIREIVNQKRKFGQSSNKNESSKMNSNRQRVKLVKKIR